MKHKLFVYFLLIFALFTVGVVSYQQYREREFKVELLRLRLDGYIDKLLQKEALLGGLLADTATLSPLYFPTHLRVTIVDMYGRVNYDNMSGDTVVFENHLQRPEIQQALKRGEGSSIRYSESLHTDYYYYVKRKGNYFYRVALPYDIETQRILNTDTSFLLFVAALFVIALFFLYLITRKYSHDLDRLKEALTVEHDKRQRLKQEMTGNISHELKTPVSSIRGYLETLLEQPDVPADKQHLFLERAFVQVLSLSVLIDDISLISKIEQAPLLFEKEVVNLKEIITEVEESLQQSITQNEVTLCNSLPAFLPVCGNRTLIFAIFRNLIENSLRYAGPRISITVELTADTTEAYTITYYDSGKGVDEKHLEKIFERFYRIDRGRTRSEGGSGLGLSIVRNAVQIHGGTIVATNRPQGGLQFVLTLRKV